MDRRPTRIFNLEVDGTFTYFANGVRVHNNSCSRFAREQLLLRTAVNIASAFLPGSGLYEAFRAVNVLRSGQGGFWEAVTIASAAFPVAKAARSLIGWRALGRSRFFRARHCNCFVAGTLVETPDGPVPIETILSGDGIITRDESCPDCPERPGTVTRVFRDVAPAILWVTLASGEVLGVTPDHEVWTHQNGWTTASVAQLGDSFLQRDGLPVEIIDAHVDRRPTRIFNLEVDGTFTYFANGVWVHNNSCSRFARGGKFAGRSGDFRERVRVSGQRFLFKGNYAKVDDTLYLEITHFWPEGVGRADLGFREMRTAAGRLADEGFKAGFQTVTLRYLRGGSTGGRNLRPVEIVFNR